MAKKGMQSKQYNDFGKGLNLFTRDTMLTENESPTAYNVWAVGKNSIKKRPGVVKLCTIPGATQVDGLGTYYNGATRELIAMAGGVLYKVNTGTAVALSAAPVSANVFTSLNRTDFCQAGGNLFVANGVENIRAYDGTAIRDQTGSIIAKYMIFYKSCLWAAGNTGAGNGTRLYRSGNDANIGNFTYNATANPLATSTYISQSDGQDLKGFFKHQDFLYPVKERSLWRTSVGSDTYQLITNELVDPSRGCDSHFSIDTVDNDNFMFNEIGIFATGYEPNILDQIRTNIVSLRIDSKLKQIQKTRLDDVVGIYYDNHYYLSYTSGGGTYNDTIMVYDRQRLGWYEFQVANGGANCFSEYKDVNGQTRLYFGSSKDGSIYYFDDTVKNDTSLYQVATVDQSQLLTEAIRNKGFENAPAFTAATNTNARWIDGTAAGSTTNDAYGQFMTKVGTVAVKFDSAQKHSGSNSLKVSTLATGSYVESYVHTGFSATEAQIHMIPVKPSTTYRYTYWMKTNVTSGDSNHGANAVFLYMNSAGVVITSSGGSAIKTTTDWTEYTGTFTTTAATYYIGPRLTVYGHTGTATLIMDAWFDDIKLEELSGATYSDVKGAVPIGASTAVQKVAQQFIPTQTGFNGVYLKKYYDYGTYTGNVTVSIVADSTDTPTGATVATVTIPNATWLAYLNTDETFITLPATLTASAKYWLIIESSTQSDTNFTSIVADNNYPYASLNAYWNGSAWTNQYKDLYFKTVYTLDTYPQMTIITDFKTGKWSFGDLSQMKFFYQALVYFGKTPGNPTVNVYVDGLLAQTISPTIGTTGYAGMGILPVGVEKIGVGGGSLDIVDTGGGDFLKIPLNKMGRNIQFEITDEDLTGTKSWELNSIHVQYIPLSTAFQPGTLS